ncbi:hypothetical protein JF50_19915 [Pseudoalteromonas luteoviolacea]|uniref:Phytanoyl-CoA dioxygenase family protein n=1 Tax=Pseudoalteromonas luteoviolacea TaxID=43657 RepID=A0A0C1Q7I0_9GAMM|nr:phytanoyl-CoA dioxygenase family protein [Pseudoalteromonas luteoviolacea]KID55480.1 hypothetical protein JF50_19915 [Pseudoalteromonas luteoviolacea]
MEEEIQAHINEYESLGFTLLKKALPPHLHTELINCCQHILQLHQVDSEQIQYAHLNNNRQVNRYFPRSHHIDSVSQTIDKIICNGPLKYILSSFDRKLSISKDHTIVSWMPEHIKKEFTGYHQDGPIGEQMDGNLHVWVPITDNRRTNFKIIPNTHKIGNLPHSMFGQFVKVDETYIEPFVQDALAIKVEVGDILIFSTRALHCLELNKQDEICWSLEFICE